MESEIESRFHLAMVEVYKTAKKDFGYNATRFLQMVTEHGGLAAAKQLPHASGVSDDFTTLWESQRLDLSVEAHVLRDEFSSLFSDEERDASRNDDSPNTGTR